MPKTGGRFDFSFHFTLTGAYEAAEARAKVTGARYKVRVNNQSSRKKYRNSKFIVVPAGR